MGYMDALTKLAAAQQVTADAVGNNTYDAGNVTPKRKLGVGEPMGVLFVITALGTTTGSSKLQIITSAAASLTSPLIIGELDLAAADHAVGKAYVVAMSHGIAYLRYIGVNFDITGTVDYTVDAYMGPLSTLSSNYETYAKNYSV